MSESDNKQSRAQFWPSGDETPLELNGYTIYEIADIVDQLPDALDTSDATAAANDIAVNKTAYVNGSKVEGNLNPQNVQFYNGDGKYAQLDAELKVDMAATATSAKNMLPSINSSVLGTAMPYHVAMGYTFSTADYTGNDNIGIGVEGTLDISKVTTYGGGDITETEFDIPIDTRTSKGTLMTQVSIFGDATADKVVSGSTFTSSNGLKLTGTYTPLDTSDATATEYDIVSGETAYVGGVKVKGLLDTSKVKMCYAGTDMDSGGKDWDLSVETYGYGDLLVDASDFGNATASDVVSGKTFTNRFGKAKTGTLTVPDLSSVTATAKYVAKGYSFVDADGNTVEGLFNSKVMISGIDGSVTVQGAITQPSSSETESFIQLGTETLYLGDAKAADVLSGKTFSSHTDGKVIVKASGTMPNNGAVTSTVDPMTITDGQSLDTAIAKGYHNGSGKVTVDNTNTSSAISTAVGETYSTLPAAVSGLDTAVNTTQANLISQIMTALTEKGYISSETDSSGESSSETDSSGESSSGTSSGGPLINETK